MQLSKRPSVRSGNCSGWEKKQKNPKLNIALAEAHYEETSADLSARLHDLIPTDTIQLAGLFKLL